MKDFQSSAIRGAFIALVLSSIFVSSAIASDGAKTADGRQLAQEWCSRCHNIEPGGPFKQFPPSFSAISVYRSSEQIFARITVPPLHSNMPELANIFSRENIENLVKYIESLEAR